MNLFTKFLNFIKEKECSHMVKIQKTLEGIW